MINRLKEALALVITLVILMLQFNSASADTRDNVVFDCDKAPDNPISCLACNIYHEARGENIPGMWMVAIATANRVEGDLYPAKHISTGPKIKKEGYEDQFCQVVYEQRKDKRSGKWTPMFSWTRDGRHDRVYNRGKWYDAQEIATKMYASHTNTGPKVVDFTGGCQWYHALTIVVDGVVKELKPYWIGDYHPTVIVGGHQCYSRDEQTYVNKLAEILPGIGMLRAVNLEAGSLAGEVSVK